MIAAILSQQEYERLTELEELDKAVHRFVADIVSELDKIRRMVPIDSDVDLALGELQDKMHHWQAER